MEYKVPLYIQLKEMIVGRINDGEYLPGEKIPSEREMATLYKINRMTVKTAINALIQEGILYKIPNKGTFVAKPKSTNRLYMANNASDSMGIGLGALLNLSNGELHNEVLEKGLVDFKFVREALGLEKEEEIYSVHRLRSVEGESVVFEYCYVPYKYFEDIDEYDFSQVSLYSYMKSKGHCPIKFKQQMKIEKAHPPLNKIMKIDQDQNVYVMEYIGIDNQGNIVEFTTSYLRCDKAIYNFQIKDFGV